MSSAIIGALVLIHKSAKECRVDFRIFNVSPNMMEIFRITRLTRVFRFGADDDDDDGPDALGAPVPRVRPPNSDRGRAGPSD